MRPYLTLLAVAGLAMAVARPSLAADQMPVNDLRDFRVGEAVSALPGSGYKDFACAAAPGTSLAGWQDYARCPADPAGLHAVSFRYDGADNPMARISDEAQATEIAGQPVLLQLLMDHSGMLAGLRIETDPAVRIHFHRGGYLFGEQAKARYGEAGWQCTELQPTPTEQPLGSTFVKERCEKRANGRHYLVSRDLHHDPALDLRQFVSASTVTILRDPSAD